MAFRLVHVREETKRAYVEFRDAAEDSTVVLWDAVSKAMISAEAVTAK